MKKYILIIITLLIIPNVYADSLINDKCDITIDNKKYNDILDNKNNTYEKFSQNQTIKIECDDTIKYIYIKYYDHNTSGLIKETNTKIGTTYLHELINLEGNNNIINIAYDDTFLINDIFIFNSDILPKWVQKWEILDKADLLLFSTHTDDEQLFFAGLIPTYINQNKKVQVIYLINHLKEQYRYNEQLDGLWEIGDKYYPVNSSFPDAYSTTLEKALSNMNNSGYSEDDLIKYETDNIRKYRPDVVVGHDENGEYSHGQHILNSYVLKKAYVLAGDSTYDSTYNSWQISKLYLHLYDQNKITMNYDIPLSKYNNKTAYEVAKIGYLKHDSQQYTWFTDWLNGKNNSYTSATQIEKYSPCDFGLYYSRVGEDQKKNDMFENILKKEIKEEIKDNNNNHNIAKKNNITKETIMLITLSIIIIIIFISKTIKTKKKKVRKQ